MSRCSTQKASLGAIGRIPSYLAHRFPAALVRFDLEKEEPVRNEQGFCVRTAPNEAGEAIGRIFRRPLEPGNRFEGYTNREESEKKILRNVFKPGDAWFRTGDLMRQRRATVTFTSSIASATPSAGKGKTSRRPKCQRRFARFPASAQANVYGVPVPGVDGRAGMAMIVFDEQLDLSDFRTHLGHRLPEYAHPLFLRLRGDMEVTATFKYTKKRLMREGFDPGGGNELIYFNDRQRGAFVPMDAESVRASPSWPGPSMIELTSHGRRMQGVSISAW